MRDSPVVVWRFHAAVLLGLSGYFGTVLFGLAPRYGVTAAAVSMVWMLTELYAPR